MRTGHSRLLAAGIGRGARGRHLRTVSLAGPSGLTNVGSANPKVVGVNYPNVLSPQLDEVIAAQGSTRLENPGPAGPGDSGIPYYGYDGDGPMMPVLDSKTFFFDETGDTSSLTEAAPDWGGFGEIQKLTQDPKSDNGTLTLFYKGDVAHTGLDNTCFLTKNEIVFVEDAGDTLHTQRNALDSAYVSATPARTGSSARRSRTPGTRAGASSTPSSMATTPPGRSSRGSSSRSGSKHTRARLAGPSTSRSSRAPTRGSRRP